MITNRSRTVRLVSTCTVSCALIRHDAISRADWCWLVSASIDSFVGNPWARSRSCGTPNRRRSTTPEYPSLPAGRGTPRHHHGARRRPHCWCETWDRDPSPGGDGRGRHRAVAVGSDSDWLATHRDMGRWRTARVLRRDRSWHGRVDDRSASRRTSVARSPSNRRVGRRTAPPRQATDAVVLPSRGMAGMDVPRPASRPILVGVERHREWPHRRTAIRRDLRC